MKIVSEATDKFRSYNSLFDKYWYRQRELNYTLAISNLENSQFGNSTYIQNLRDETVSETKKTSSLVLNPSDLINVMKDEKGPLPVIEKI